MVIWHNFLDKPAQQLQDVVDDYNEAIGTEAVVIETLPSSGFMKAVNMAVKNGVGPDIVFRYPDDATAYALTGDVVEFSMYINDSDIGIANFEESLYSSVYDKATGYNDGKMYSLPISITGPVVYYNIDIYEDLGLHIPDTWDELYANGKSIYESKGIPGVGIDSIADVMQMLIHQGNYGYIDTDNKKVLFDDEEFKGEVNLFVENVNNGALSVTPAGDYWHNDFNNGLVASFIGSSASEVYIEDSVNWGVFPIPQGENKWYPLWTRSAIVFSSTEEKELSAYQFLKYLIEPETNVRFRVMEESLSPYYSVQEISEYRDQLSGSITLGIVQDSLEFSGTIPPVAGSADMRDYLDEMVFNILSGNDLDAEFEACIKNCNDALNME